MKDPRPPAYSMAARFPPVRKFNTPGPNQYTVPTTLGAKVPDKPAAAAYTMYVLVNFTNIFLTFSVGLENMVLKENLLLLDLHSMAERM